MITEEEFLALVETYRKYEWLLRRVTLTGEGPAPFGLPADVTVSPGVVDVAWFSRSPRNGAIPWEVRYLGPTQYALVVHLDEDSPDFAAMVRETEQRLADAVAAKRFA